MELRSINIIGLGYIGLPTALMFAANGISVVGTDINIELVNTLKTGRLTFQEKGLEELFNIVRKKGIDFSTDYQTTNFYIIAVPTPYDTNSKKIDPTYLIEAFKKVISVCERESVVVIESTVSPGTIDKFIRPMVSEVSSLGKTISIAHAPERIIPGNMIYELINNHRIIGADSYQEGLIVKEKYSVFCKGRIEITDVKSAEMIKVIENTYRDINIAFANEILKICSYDGLDAYRIIELANMHPRVNILKPGPGVGGHCISVDPWFLVGDYPGLANIILAARKVNDSMPSFVLERAKAIMNLEGIRDTNRVGIYGLTYKEDVDDVRESPSLQLIRIMEKNLAKPLKVFDPYVKRQIVENQYFSFESFISEVDMLIVMVAHKHLLENVELVKSKVILDTKKCINTGKSYCL